jgi:hypothetical protein
MIDPTIANLNAPLSDRHEAAPLRLGRRPAPLPTGLTEQAVAEAITAIGARLDDPDVTARDIIATAFVALSRNGHIHHDEG